MLYLNVVSRSVSQKLTCKDPSNTRDRNERLFDFDEVFSDRIGQTEIFDKVRTINFLWLIIPVDVSFSDFEFACLIAPMLAIADSKASRRPRFGGLQ
jgi:hypothetical protein